MLVFVPQGIYCHNGYVLKVLCSGYYELNDRDIDCINAANKAHREKSDE